MDVVIDEGSCIEFGNIYNPAHIPLGVLEAQKYDEGQPNKKAFDRWWIGRSIPASRDNIESALIALGIEHPSELITKCYGLSLSDQYWVCPKHSGLLWDNINFFENNFSQDIGDILFGHEPKDIDTIDMISPDNTSDGQLRKKWIISDGKRLLMKSGGGGSEQEPFNEVVATAIMRRLNIPHVPYMLTFYAGKPYSLCETFVTPETELIPAWQVFRIIKKSNNDSNLTHLLRCCDKLGIQGVQDSIDKMLVLDYVIENEDRHWNNFGFIRNADTLEWMGLAPIYDNGTSLWHNKHDQQIGLQGKSKTFRTTHAEQIKLVKDLTWFNIETLNGITNECEEIFSNFSLVLPERWKAIANAIWERVVQIEQIQISKGQQKHKEMKDKSLEKPEDSYSEIGF